MVSEYEGEPSKTSFAEQEDAMTDFRVEVINNETITRGRWIVNSLSTSKDHELEITYDNARSNVDKFGASKG